MTLMIWCFLGILAMGVWHLGSISRAARRAADELRLIAEFQKRTVDIEALLCEKENLCKQNERLTNRLDSANMKLRDRGLSIEKHFPMIDVTERSDELKSLDRQAEQYIKSNGWSQSSDGWRHPEERGFFSLYEAAVRQDQRKVVKG